MSDTKSDLWPLLTVDRIGGILHGDYEECILTSVDLREMARFLFAECTAVQKMYEKARTWADRRLAEELGHAMREASTEDESAV